MKKQLFLLSFLAACFLAFIEVGPQTKVVTSSEVVWAGIDFSEAKLIGSEGFSDPDDIKTRFFESWNNLIINEGDKYDIKKFYSLDKVTNDLSVVEERNEIPDADELVINSDYSFEEGQLEEIISQYDLEEASEGTGLVYVVEAFNKTKEIATIHVVFFDIASKEILWTEKYEESPRGFGFRNYWAGAIFKVLEASGKDYEKAMKKQSKGK